MRKNLLTSTWVNAQVPDCPELDASKLVQPVTHHVGQLPVVCRNTALIQSDAHIEILFKRSQEVSSRAFKDIESLHSRVFDNLLRKVINMDVDADLIMPNKMVSDVPQKVRLELVRGERPTWHNAPCRPNGVRCDSEDRQHAWPSGLGQ